MILVIGATGKVGSELVRLLSGAGIAVRAMTRDPEKADRIRLPNVELVRGDLNEPKSLKTVFQGVDKLFQISSPGREQLDEQNMVLKRAKKAGVGLIVRMTAMGSAPDSLSQILRWHAENERRVIKSGIPYVILQPNFFMQNMLGHAGSIRDQGAFYMPTDEGRASQVDTRDIAEVALKALTGPEHAGRVYEITGGESVTAHYMSEVLSQALNRQIKYIPVTPEAAVAAMIRSGVPEWAAADVVKIFGYWADSLSDRVSGVVESLTGRPPRTFRDFVRDYATAFGS